jgi:hypothetical protein
MEKQYLEIREARRSLFSWDITDDWGCDIINDFAAGDERSTGRWQPGISQVGDENKIPFKGIV